MFVARRPCPVFAVEQYNDMIYVLPHDVSRKYPWSLLHMVELFLLTSECSSLSVCLVVGVLESTII